MAGEGTIVLQGFGPEVQPGSKTVVSVEDRIAAEEAAVAAEESALAAAAALGNSVASATINQDSGALILTKNNGDTFNAGVAKGAQGPRGFPGVDGSNVLPTDAAVAGAVLNPSSQTNAAVIQVAGSAGGGSGDTTVEGITDATDKGKELLKAANAGVARQAIGAGTSDLALGTSATTAKKGDWKPATDDVTDATTAGKAVMKASSPAVARSAIGALGSPNGTFENVEWYASRSGLPAVGSVKTLYLIDEV